MNHIDPHPFDAHDDEARLYGPDWAPQLGRLQQAIEAHASDIAESFHRAAGQDAHLRNLLPQMLSAQERERFRSWQTSSLLDLAAPGLTPKRHRDTALRLGHLYMQLGLPALDLMRGQEALHSAVERSIDTHEHAQALTIMSHRLMRSLAWQAEALQERQAVRNESLQRITELTWEIDNYADLIAQTAEILARHADMAGCAFAKPDEQGIFHFEYIAGTPGFKQCLIEIDAQNRMPGAYGEGIHEHGTMGRAWYSTRIEHCLNIDLDPPMRLWQAHVARHAAFRSIIAIPLCRTDDIPISMLCLYGQYPGGVVSSDQKAFVEQLQTLLLFACSRLHALAGPVPGVSYNARQRWRTLIHGDHGLRTYYQPVVSLADSAPVGVFALTHLLDGDRLLPPSKFQPLLSSDDFFSLYCLGINQAMAERETWRRTGLGDRRLGINLRFKALADPRYLHEIQAAMARHNCPGSLLTLHILDMAESGNEFDQAAEHTLAQFKSMGVFLTADDLGSGHSSLERLRQLPFNTVKIDRSVISLMHKDPTSVLCFIHRLTRLGHTLGKRVLIDGVDSLDMLEAVAVLKADGVQGQAVCPLISAAQVAAWLGQNDTLLLPIYERPRSKLAKLASLLLWEERLHLAVERPSASLSTASRDDLSGPAFPFLATRSQQRQLFTTARAYGLHSEIYRAARQHFITQLFREQALTL